MNNSERTFLHKVKFLRSCLNRDLMELGKVMETFTGYYQAFQELGETTYLIDKTYKLFMYQLLGSIDQKKNAAEELNELLKEVA